MKDAAVKLEELKRKRQRIERDKAAADARVESAKSQRSVIVEKLAKAGVNDPKQIKSKLAEFQKSANNLLAEISEGIPERYRDA